MRLLRRSRLVRTAGIALIVYGLVGIFVGIVIAVVGAATLNQVSQLQAAVDRERGTVVTSLRSVSRTIADTASATGNFQRSLDGARESAGAASQVALDTGATFRGIGQALLLQIFGVQPFAGLTPQFDQSAVQMEALSATLAATRDALSQNSTDVQRVGRDLTAVQQQVDLVAATLDRMAGTGTAAELRPYQVAFYGVCLLFTLQSLFSLIAGFGLIRAHDSLAALAEIIALHRDARTAESRTGALRTGDPRANEPQPVALAARQPAGSERPPAAA